MDNILTTFKLDGLLCYLIKRIKLRFIDRYRNASSHTNVTILGHTVSLDLIDLEQKYLAADCVREPENLIVYRAIANSGLVDTFIDIGANCGHVAASIMSDYKHILLVEPNPKLAVLLREIYGNQTHIAVRECAIVDDKSVGYLMLTVPDDSSGLATLAGTDLSKQHDAVHTYKVKASTLATEVEGLPMNTAYIKIDVEGFEANIIHSARALINEQRPIVGFEALSNQAALKCSRLFKDYVFYCARFDFLENGGALSRSIVGMMKGLIYGAHIEIIRLDDIEKSELGNFSQIFSVPREKSSNFENAVEIFATGTENYNLSDLKTWS